jgi:KTSC domain
MKRLAGGSLRAAGYDAGRRTLVVELTSGTFEYSGVSVDTFRRLVSASSPWSFFRDNIQEEFMERRIR